MDYFKDIAGYLWKTEDPTLLILRAHLLVEELLRDILARICRSPDELPRLSFYEVLCICRAVVGRYDEPAWDFVARLNEVRNRMAHHLDPGNLDDLLGSVVEKLGPDYTKKLRTPVDRFRLAMGYVCGYFDSISGSVHLRKPYDSEGDV